MTPEQAHDLSGPSYATKLALDYTRPSKEDYLAHWAAMGLNRDFWTL